MMESLETHGSGGINNGLILPPFSRYQKLHAQPKKYDKDFDDNVSHLHQIVIKKDNSSISISETRSQSVKPKVTQLMKKVECKKDPKLVWNSIPREKQMPVRQLHEQ